MVAHELFQPGSEERVDEVVGCSAVHHYREDRFVSAEASRRQGGGGCHKCHKNRGCRGSAEMTPEDLVQVGAPESQELLFLPAYSIGADAEVAVDPFALTKEAPTSLN